MLIMPSSDTLSYIYYVRMYIYVCTVYYFCFFVFNNTKTNDTIRVMWPYFTVYGVRRTQMFNIDCAELHCSLSVYECNNLNELLSGTSLNFDCSEHFILPLCPLVVWYLTSLSRTLPWMKHCIVNELSGTIRRKREKFSMCLRF